MSDHEKDLEEAFQKWLKEHLVDESLSGYYEMLFRNCFTSGYMSAVNTLKKIFKD